MELIVDVQSFPSIDYFKKLIKFKHIKIEVYESFKKASFHNRYIISGANGLVNLTIPIKGGREQKSLITEIDIDDTTAWRTRHWRSITSGYSKAPFFEYYEEEVRKLIFNHEKGLFNFNFFILENICKWLNIKLLFEFTHNYSFYLSEFDFRNKILPKSFQDSSESWKPKYSQVFEDRVGFQPNLSILDLLFCEGPNSHDLLKRSIK